MDFEILCIELRKRELQDLRRLACSNSRADEASLEKLLLVFLQAARVDVSEANREWRDGVLLGLHAYARAQRRERDRALAYAAELSEALRYLRRVQREAKKAVDVDARRG
jgi:hypothetical protein